MTYAEAMQSVADGHAIVRSSWGLANVCIVSFRPGELTWLDGHKVLPWSPSSECLAGRDWIIADDILERDRQTRRAAIESIRTRFPGVDQSVAL